MEILHPKHWRPAKGFADGVAAEGRQVFLAGQVGWNADQQFASDDFVTQVEQALRNVVEVLAQARALPQHLVRLTWYIVDKREYLAAQEALGAAYRAVMGRHFSVMTVVEVAGLLEDRARVEIEVTAVLEEPR